MDQAQQLRNVIKKHNQINQNTARVVTVTSGKGGVGKSNLAVNLAVQLRKEGKRVVIFDADFGLANVEVMFGAIHSTICLILYTVVKASKRLLRRDQWISALYLEAQALSD